MSFKKLFIYIISAFVIVLIISSISSKKSKVIAPLEPIVFQDTTKLGAFVKGYHTYMQSHLDTFNSVGAAMAIVKNDSVLLLEPYGVKRVNTTDSVNVHTVFRLASVSKGFAGILLALLDEQGLLDLDETVKASLSNFELKDSLNTHATTLENLLSHTTGLVPHAYDNLIEDDVPVNKITAKLNEVDISAPPGKIYGYQNVVFSLVDTISAQKTNLSYPQLLNSRIFTPLKMYDASATFNGFIKTDNFAWPHARTKLTYQDLKLNKGYYNIAPAAGVNASITDMSKWLLALLGNNEKAISKAVIDSATKEIIYTPLKRSYTRYWGPVKERYYGLGWRIFMFHGRKIVYHGGYVRGYRAEIAFCPEENIGMVFLLNSPNRIASMSVPKFFELYFNVFDGFEENLAQK